MGKNIAVGTIIKLGSAGAPTTLVDKSSWFDTAEIGRQLETVDVTNFADTDYARNFISALLTNTLSGSGKDDVVFASSPFAFFDAAAKGTSHTAGRGKIDFAVLVGGAVTNNTQITGTVIVQSGNLSLNLADAISHSHSFQVDGAITVSAQS